jgi:hypothetical protein
VVSRLACGSAQVEAAREANEPITVTLPDGKEVRAWRRAASAVLQLRYLAKVHSWQRLFVQLVGGPATCASAARHSAPGARRRRT